MSGFTKLVPEIIQSSIWNEPSDIRVVWITMLAIKDENGYVRGSDQTLARMANVTHDAVTEALRIFTSPDPHSCTPDDDGRRIEQYPGGWLVLNHEKYREREYVIKEQTRERVRKYRERHKEKDNVTQGNVTTTLPSASASVSASSSASGKGDARGSNERSTTVDHSFEECWTSFGKYGVKKKALEYWKRINDEDRESIKAAIPDYIKVINAGRKQMQFEGWINPLNRKWDVDWKKAVSVEKAKPEKAYNHI